MEVTVGEKRHRVRRRALVAVAGLAVFGIISGLLAYQSAKERGATMTRSLQAAAGDRMAVPPPIDVSSPGVIETATFALG